MFCNTPSQVKYAVITALPWEQVLRRRRPRRTGFSLVEIMVVVVIIGILAGAVALQVSDYTSEARQNRARSDIATIVDAIETYRLKHGRYPSNSEGLANVSIKTQNDPWGNAYGYNQPGRDSAPFEVFTLGADSREGGEDVNTDIYSWQLGDAGHGN